jgi:flagellin-like hook-associated protein FlgL
VSLTNSSYKGNYLFGGTNGDKIVYEYTEGTVHTFPANAAGTLAAAGTPNAMMDYTDNKLYQFKRLDPGTVRIVLDPGGAGTVAVEGTDYTVDYAQGTITALAGGVLDGTTLPVQVTFNHYNKVNRENMGTILREIEQGVKVRINMSADEVFEDSAANIDMIGVVTELVDALNKNSGTRISGTITSIDKISDILRAAQSRNGAKVNRFELTTTRNDNRKIEISRLQSELEDLDFADAIMEFSLSENVYNASLRAGAKVILPTLGDYL